MQSQSVSLDAASPGQLFNYPFRIFFLSVAVMALLWVPLWVAVVTGRLDLPLALPPLAWHRHEMLFGFLSAAIAGFLLTAACVWTQTERTHGLRLMGLWLVWLAGRLLLALGEGWPEALVQGVNLAFIPLVMADAGWRIWRARQRRQLMLLVVLGLLWFMQIAYVRTFNPVFVSGALVLAMALSGIIGGRITPAFSTGWLRQQGRDEATTIRVAPTLDALQVAAMLGLSLMVLSGARWGSMVTALVAAALMLARLAGWKGWLVTRNPLLWILHLSLLWIPVALLLFAGSSLFGWPASVWTHAAGLGVVASLILGVMARVSLGHTGRPLTLPRGMVVAFLAIQAAAVVRVVTALGGIAWQSGVMLSGLLWMLAFALFLLRYAGILMRPRSDGLPG
ncbi:NnrS family protein [Marinobacter sp. NFXS9]|uniref:NnrS family protein n=1 Tax=Marinobacter sp. NFXS9 TaxID=2818433 RepID=UPI0032DFC5E9